MKAGWRILIAAAAVAQAAGASSALAQDAQPAPTANTTDTIGPRELRNFQLNGTVTRPAENPPAAAPAQTTRPAAPATATETPAARSQGAPAAATRTAPATANRTPPPPAASRSVTVDLPPPTPSAELPLPNVTPVNDLSAPAAEPAFAPNPDPATPGESDGPSPLPWLLALLALAGGAAFYFLRVRPRAQFAGAAGLSEFRGSPEPEAQRVPAPRPAPRPAPTPPQRPASGIVSTRLRPWLEIEFTPERAVVDENKAAIEFVVSIFNSGSAPARDILVEGGLFNAGPHQDKQIAMFFENPDARGKRVAGLPPLQRLSVRSAVLLPRSQVKPIEIEGRPLLVPLVAFNVLYRFGNGSEGQTSVSYLVGKQTKADKLAPFRLDLGPRITRGLGIREHEMRVRK